MPEQSFTPAQKAACARREAAYRRSCYPKWAKVSSVEHLPYVKRLEIQLMEAIAADYEQQANTSQAVQGQLFPAACPACTQRRDQCLCDVVPAGTPVPPRPMGPEPEF